MLKIRTHRFVVFIILGAILIDFNLYPQTGREMRNRPAFILGGDSLGQGNSALEFSAGVFRWAKLEFSYGAGERVDIGGWVDFQPILLAVSTVGIMARAQASNKKTLLGFRVGAGLGIGVLGDNIAGHGIEFSGEGAQGYLLEMEVSFGKIIGEKTAFVQQSGFLLTDQRNTRRAKWGGTINKMTLIPYFGLGLEKSGRRFDVFAVIRLAYILRFGSNEFIFPDAKVGIMYRF